MRVDVTTQPFHQHLRPHQWRNRRQTNRHLDRCRRHRRQPNRHLDRRRRHRRQPNRDLDRCRRHRRQTNRHLDRCGIGGPVGVHRTAERTPHDRGGQHRVTEPPGAPREHVDQRKKPLLPRHWEIQGIRRFLVKNRAWWPRMCHKNRSFDHSTWFATNAARHPNSSYDRR